MSSTRRKTENQRIATAFKQHSWKGRIAAAEKDNKPRLARELIRLSSYMSDPNTTPVTPTPRPDTKKVSFEDDMAKATQQSGRAIRKTGNKAKPATKKTSPTRSKPTKRTEASRSIPPGKTVYPGTTRSVCKEPASRTTKRSPAKKEYVTPHEQPCPEDCPYKFQLGTIEPIVDDLVNERGEALARKKTIRPTVKRVKPAEYPHREDCASSERLGYLEWALGHLQPMLAEDDEMEQLKLAEVFWRDSCRS